jgi:hypothetical protein
MSEPPVVLTPYAPAPLVVVPVSPELLALALSRPSSLILKSTRLPSDRCRLPFRQSANVQVSRVFCMRCNTTSTDSKLTNAHLAELLQAMGRAAPLVSLDVGSNLLDGDGLLSLAQAVRNLPRLSTVVFDGAILSRDSKGARNLGFLLDNAVGTLTSYVLEIVYRERTIIES